MVALEMQDKESEDNKAEDRGRKEVKISAGWLIETACSKGLRKGDVGVYALHALILVNYGGASGEDVLRLATEIKGRVQNQFDISLIAEVRIVGGAV